MFSENMTDNADFSVGEKNYFEEENWENRKKWPDFEGPNVILHPDDPLMKRFQDALKAHLTRTSDKLDEEIYEIKMHLKSLLKEKETRNNQLRMIRSETETQKKLLQNYQVMLSDMTNMRELHQIKTERTKEIHGKTLKELSMENKKLSETSKQLHELTNKVEQFTNFEKEISDDISFSKRISEKDKIIQREKEKEKKKQDFVLYKLMEENWILDSENKMLGDQMALREKEKDEMNGAIASVNAEISVIEKEQKIFIEKWNSVLVDIKQRDEIFNALGAKYREMRDAYKNLQSQLMNIKKETVKEIENHELLTVLETKLSSEFFMTQKNFESEKEKLEFLENELLKYSKILEQCQEEEKVVSRELRFLELEEKNLQKEQEKIAKQKNDLEDGIVKRTSETVIFDKTVRYLNKLLQEAKDENKEQELVLSQLERVYRTNLFEIEKSICNIENSKLDLEELIRKNAEKEKNLDKFKDEIKQKESSIAAKQREIFLLDKKIEEILETTKGNETNLDDLRINSLEDQIEKLVEKNKNFLSYWARQEKQLMTASQQRSDQLQQFGLLTKQIIIMEQKNYKLGYELEKQEEEQTNLNRKMRELKQSLSQKSSKLALKRQLKDNLENEYSSAKDDFVMSLKDAERKLKQLQVEIQEISQKKIVLMEEVRNVQWSVLAWKKKVEMATETSKTIKEEKKVGSDISAMKSEIHRMEIRLSDLKKAQGKLMQDMEFCVARRENILEKANAEEKRNFKSQQMIKTNFQKRLEEQRSKIKKMEKETTQTNKEISVIEEDQKVCLEKLDAEQKKLREIEDTIPDIDKKITEMCLIKNHNLEVLIRKQRKVQMLEKIKTGKYKNFFKSGVSLHDEMCKQKSRNALLKEIMNQTKKDFPLLKNEVQKILLSLEI